jgi:hypothetical protein
VALLHAVMSLGGPLALQPAAEGGQGPLLPLPWPEAAPPGAGGGPGQPLKGIKIGVYDEVRQLPLYGAHYPSGVQPRQCAGGAGAG